MAFGKRKKQIIVTKSKKDLIFNIGVRQQKFIALGTVNDKSRMEL